MSDERYIPHIHEAVVPDEGQWAELEGKNVLILSILEWEGTIQQSREEQKTVWMYDRGNDAYLFCFRLQDGKDYAIAFPREHAGVFLTDSRAHNPFSLLVTAKSLQEKTLRPCILFQDLSLMRHPKAGW